MKSLYRKGMSFVRIDEINISLFNSTIYITTLLLVTIIITPVFASEAAKVTPTPEQNNLMMECNLAARNSLINMDIQKVEVTCTKAMNEMDKAYTDKSYMINPIMNLAFIYSLTGEYAKADPLLAKAKSIGEEYYKAGSSEMKNINDLIEDHNIRKGKPAQFKKAVVTSPH
jgi:hypothetical protein